jgi:uncharacterized membrane protein
MKNIFPKILGLFLALSLIAFLILDFSRLHFYWHDEAFILQHISGYNREELVLELYDSQPKTKADFTKFQGSNQDKNPLNIIQSIIKSSPEHPPLYFLFLWLWSKLFGHEEKSLLISAIFIWVTFLLALYRLNLTLFNSKNTAFITTFIAVLSPRFFGLATDIREYGLWILLTTLSSLFFLKSWQNPEKTGLWWLYGLTLTAGLYTHIFFIFVAITNLVYFLLNYPQTPAIIRTKFCQTYCLAWLAFLPWLLVLIYRQAPIYFWAKYRMSLPDLTTRWLSAFTGVVGKFDNNLDYLLLVVLAASIFVVYKYLDKKSSNYLIILTCVPFLSLVIIDFLLPAKYSSVGRFYLPALLGMLICFGYLIAQGLRHKNIIIKFTSLLLIQMIIIRFLLGIQDLSQRSTYAGYGSEVINSSSIIKQASNPLVIGEVWFDLLPLSYKLPENTHYLFINQATLLPTHESLKNYSDVYVINPSSFLKKNLEDKQLELEQTNNPTLWILQEKHL